MSVTINSEDVTVSDEVLELIGVSCPVVYDSSLKVHCFNVSGANFQCLYRCMSVAVYGDERHWLQLKSDAITYMCDNFATLGLFAATENGYAFESANEYRKAMSRPSALGSVIEAHAIGKLFEFNVVVIHDNNIRFSVIDVPAWPIVTLVLRGSYNSGHFNLAFYLPENLRREVFETNGVPYAIDSPFMRNKSIPFVASQLQRDCSVNIQNTPVKSPSQCGKKRSATKPLNTSSPKTPNSSGSKTPQSKSKSTAGRNLRTPSSSHRKQLCFDEDEAELDDPVEVEDQLVDPTAPNGGFDFPESHSDSSSDCQCLDDDVEEISAVSQPIFNRDKPWVAIPPTDYIRPTWQLSHVQGRYAAKSYLSAMLLGDEDWSSLETHRLPPLDQVCPHCAAKFRLTEISGLCCNHGKVKMSDGAKFIPPSESIVTLFSRQDERSKTFLNNIRNYNNMFSTVFFRSRIESTHQGPYSYLEINGKVTYDPQCYLSTQLENIDLPAQLYFVEQTLDRVNERRMIGHDNEDLDMEVIQLLENYFQEHNKYVQCFKTAREMMEEERVKAAQEGRQVKDVYLAINPRPKARSGYRVTAEDYVNSMLDNEFSRPCKDFLAAVYVGDIKDINFDNYFVHRVRQESDQFPRMTGSESSLGTQQYPLIYLHGENSWFDTNSNKSESLGSYFSYRVQDRGEDFNPLLSSAKLFSQYLLDAAIKIEYNKLKYIENHQRRLKASTYTSLRQFIQAEAREQGKEVGRFVVLNKSFKGSPRYRQDRFYAGMAIAAHKGVPSWFITFTCNPNWAEINEQLPEGVSFRERPDIVVRVFEQKLKSFMSDLTFKQLFGEVTAYMVSTEFQKRGLPHAHILLIMKDSDRPRSQEQVDRFIQAELPPTSETRYRELVERHMIHSPCHLMDARKSKPFCFADGVNCRFKYPKKFSDQGDMTARRVQYRRPNNGRQCLDRGTGKPVDNRNVVSHNRYLLERYDAHINVEFTKSDLKAFKYLCIYTHKNPDKAYVSLTDQNKANESSIYEWNEVSHYKEFRYFGPHEALYTIWGLPINQASHSVKVLNFHLPGQQQIIFEEGQEEQAIEEQDHSSHLDGWFTLNSVDPSARQYRFIDIPSHYTWHTKEKIWKVRKTATTLGRLPTIIPTDSTEELFALRCILGNARGARSFLELRTVDGVEYSTLREAAIAMGLLENTNLIEATFAELCTVCNPRSLRRSFVLFMKHCRPDDPLAFFNKFKVELSEDFAYRSGRSEVTEVHFQLALHDIAKQLERFDMTLQELGLPQLDESVTDSYVFENYEPPQFTRDNVDTEIGTFNAGQRNFFDSYMQTLKGESDIKLFLLTGAGGCGKTYLLNTTIKETELQGKKIRVSAYSGIAATLLINAHTVHNTFGLPVNPLDTESAMCNVSTESVKAERLRQADTFIIDEVSMVNKWQLSCIDRFLRLLMHNDHPFGGKIMILAGDFRQTLPVIRKGTRADTVAACITNHRLWKEFKMFQLNENVRAQDDQQYAKFLLTVGDGSGNVQGTPRIELNTKFYTQSSEELIDKVFGTGAALTETTAAILTPLNDTMNEINETILKKVNGSEKEYLSCTEFIPDIGKIDEFNVSNFHISKDMVESLQHGSLPPHRLTLRIGCMVMLLNNISVSEGLCNGTRLKVVQFFENTIKCKIMSGSRKGEIFFLFRVKQSRDDTDFPGTITRTQFPIRLAYAMTINKSQGQTLSTIGLYLPRPCFTHGQLYTAMSRVRNSNSVHIRVCKQAEQGSVVRFGKCRLLWTRNEIYYEVINSVLYHPSNQA